jgi:hypothetical protein
MMGGGTDVDAGVCFWAAIERLSGAAAFVWMVNRASGGNIVVLVSCSGLGCCRAVGVPV